MAAGYAALAVALTAIGRLLLHLGTPHTRTGHAHGTVTGSAAQGGGLVLLTLGPLLCLLESLRWLTSARRGRGGVATAGPGGVPAGRFIVAAVGAYAASYAVLVGPVAIHLHTTANAARLTADVSAVQGSVLPPILILLACLLLRPVDSLLCQRWAAFVIGGVAVAVAVALWTGHGQWLVYPARSAALDQLLPRVDGFLVTWRWPSVAAAGILTTYAVGRLVSDLDVPPRQADNRWIAAGKWMAVAAVFVGYLASWWGHIATVVPLP